SPSAFCIERGPLRSEASVSSAPAHWHLQPVRFSRRPIPTMRHVCSFPLPRVDQCPRRAYRWFARCCNSLYPHWPPQVLLPCSVALVPTSVPIAVCRERLA